VENRKRKKQRVLFGDIAYVFQLQDVKQDVNSVAGG